MIGKYSNLVSSNPVLVEYFSLLKHGTYRLYAESEYTCSVEAAYQDSTCRESYDEQLQKVREQWVAGMDLPVKTFL